MTPSQYRRLMENAVYWRDRETAQREAYILTEEEEMREVNRIYRDMYRWAEREISAFYGRYADAEGIDITEAKKRVSNLDIEEYERLAKKYVADKDFSPRANQEMRLYNATMRINRMELLKAQVGLKLVDGFNDIEKHYEKIATDRAVQELERMSGILGNTLTDVQTAKYARNIVNADFYNANFSERIWSHMDNLRSDLAIELQKGFIAGISSQEMARRIKEHSFEKSYKDAHRLVVTELRRVQTDVARQQYEESGVEEYEYCAVNPNACPICRDLDGKVFKVSEMKAGENAPPIHPNCHCTTAPKVDEDEYEQWLSWLERGGTTEQWDQMSPTERQNWYDNLVKSIPKAQPSPQPDTFTPAQNIKEAEDYAKSLGLEANYKGVSIGTANAMNESFKRGIDFCDKVKDRLRMVGSGQEGNKALKKALTDWYMQSKYADRYRQYGRSEETIKKLASRWASGSVGRISGDTYAYARNMDRSSLGESGKRFGGIFVNNAWADYGKMTRQLKEDVADGFHPVGCDTVKSVFDHEMGHQLDYALGLKKDKELMDYYRTLTEADIRKGLSRYATKNEKEFIAEAYAEYLNNPEPRPIAQKVGRIIEERAKKK